MLTRDIGCSKKDLMLLEHNRIDRSESSAQRIDRMDICCFVGVDLDVNRDAFSAFDHLKTFEKNAGSLPHRHESYLGVSPRLLHHLHAIGISLW